MVKRNQNEDIYADDRDDVPVADPDFPTIEDEPSNVVVLPKKKRKTAKKKAAKKKTTRKVAKKAVAKRKAK